MSSSNEKPPTPVFHAATFTWRKQPGPRNYSPKAFFRQAPNSCLKRYFHKRKLLREFDFDQPKKTLVDQIYEAFVKLSLEQRRETENDFRDIFVVACESGMKALFREANIEGLDLKAQIADEDAGDFEMAFWAFFEARELFDRALLFAHADGV